MGTWLARHQAWLFFPMLLLEGLHLHVAGVRALLSRRSSAVKWLEGVLLIAHIVGYLAAVFLVLPVPMAVLFIVIQQSVFGVYLGCAFAPNHKGMPVFGENEKVDFLRRQVITSRNIRGGWFTDFALGGLNYQIEHHLFPSMPRPNLRHAQAPIRAFCEANGITYSQTGLLDSYTQVLRHLHTVGAAPKPVASSPSA
jgi:fatty acid desaturase